MTTEILQLAQDMNAENDIYLLSKMAKCHLSGAAFIRTEWDEKIASTDKSIRQLSLKLQRAFPKGGHWLFIGDRRWQPDNRIARHKKLWAALLSRRIKVPEGERRDEVIVSSSEGIKHFGLIKCEPILDSAIASILRSGLATQLIFAEESVAIEVSKHLLSSGWEHKGNGPPEKIIDLLCEYDMFTYLPLGWFDDRESGCAVLAKASLASLPFPELI